MAPASAFFGGSMNTLRSYLTCLGLPTRAQPAIPATGPLVRFVPATMERVHQAVHCGGGAMMSLTRPMKMRACSTVAFPVAPELTGRTRRSERADVDARRAKGRPLHQVPCRSCGSRSRTNRIGAFG
jgi:hypothetical protein